MPLLGEFCLWAALGLIALSATAALGGAWTGRADLAVFGGRAGEGTAVLLALSLVGLGAALVAVRLDYAYVAAHAGFDLPRSWRVAAVWTGPAGGALTLCFLTAVATAASGRYDRSRQAAARTGALAILTGVGLALVLVGPRPFLRPPAPASAGLGLPAGVREVVWQVELWATYLATALAAIPFAGVVGEQISESPGTQALERRAAGLAGAALALAALAAAWRGYAASGDALGAPAAGDLLAVAPAWLVTIAYLHAPGGAATPAWAARWARAMGVVLFPASLGTAAAILGGAGGEPAAALWAGGLSVGVISGGLTGLARAPIPEATLEAVPGYGAFALAGGALALVGAGGVAVLGLLHGSPGSPAALYVLGALAVVAVLWMIGRSGAGTGVRTGAIGVAALAAIVMGVAGGGPELTAGAAIGGLAMVGGGAELLRVTRARRRLATRGGEVRPARAAVYGARAARRLASAAGHVGVALLGLGLLGRAATRTEVRQIVPGDDLGKEIVRGLPAHVTYLGLSRYRPGGLDKTVASFRWGSGADARLVTASRNYEFASGREYVRAAVIRGVFRDVVVELVHRIQDEAIVCRVTVRPLGSLIWLGGGVMLLGFLGAGRSGDRGGNDAGGAA